MGIWEYIKAALTENAFAEFTHIPSHRVDLDFPRTVEELSAYDAVMVSDCGANTFNLPMEPSSSCGQENHAVPLSPLPSDT